MPVSGSRLPKSEVTRLKLLDCAVDEIVESGPDRLGFTAVARRAQMSTGALYARYENTDELLIDVWEHKCRPYLDGLIRDMEAALGGAGDAVAALSARITGPEPEFVALMRTMAVAGRSEPLQEVVGPSVAEAFAQALSRRPALPHLASHMFGYLIGVCGTGLAGLEWQGPVGMMSEVVSAAVAESVDPELIEMRWAETPAVAPGDDADRRLFDAVAEVIGKVGVDRATVSRIARRAGVNPASIYMRYEDKDALLIRVVAFISELGVQRNEDLVSSFSSPEQMIRWSEAMLRGNASDEYRRVRRLRLETMIAAGHHAPLGDVVRRMYLEAARRDIDTVDAGHIFPDEIALPFALFGRFSFFGIALMREHGFLASDDPFGHSIAAGIIEHLGGAVRSGGRP